MSDVLLSELTSTDIDWVVNVGHLTLLETNTPVQLTSTQDSQTSEQLVHLVLDGQLSTVEPQQNSTRNSQISSNVDSDCGPRLILSSGDILGGETILHLPLPTVSYQATEPTRLMSIPSRALAAKMQQDREFSAHFYRAIAILFSEQLRKLYASSAPWLRDRSHMGRDALTIFGGLRDSDLDWLVSKGKVQRLTTGDFMLQAGRPVDALHIVLDGSFSVALLEGDINPLAVCFNCPIETASTMTIVNTINKGEIAGAIAFLDSRPLPVTIRALQDSLVLSIPQADFTLKLQQDLAFATRFYTILGTQLAGMLHNALDHSEARESQVAPQSEIEGRSFESVELGEELDLDSLQKMSDGANRFNWMLSRLGIGQRVNS